jgi:hypothetical protein
MCLYICIYIYICVTEISDPARWGLHALRPGASADFLAQGRESIPGEGEEGGLARAPSSSSWHVLVPITAGANVKVSRKFRRVPLDLRFGTSIGHPGGRNKGFDLNFSTPRVRVRASILHGAPYDWAAL